ncbi:hypothetical protein [Streptomyces sp. NPDC004589]|uniref:hypothetical protein n=1 Tax=Streptomyces sp. NPDC004589 TaxID=3154553 RepID=UPI0033BCA0CF
MTGPDRAASRVHLNRFAVWAVVKDMSLSLSKDPHVISELEYLLKQFQEATRAQSLRLQQELELAEAWEGLQPQVQTSRPQIQVLARLRQRRILQILQRLMADHERQEQHLQALSRLILEISRL